MAATIRVLTANEYIPPEKFPSQKQLNFLAYSGVEAMYGGAAFSGKSVALLVGALMYVDVPGYAALLLRRSFSDLQLPNSLMDLADQWLRPRLGMHAWDRDTKTWTFPSGATISFGFLKHEVQKHRYQGTSFQYIGFDELTQFEESQYTYLFGWLRNTAETKGLPVKMRSATNPGGVGHTWVKNRFIMDESESQRVFVPATLEDNPSANAAEYERSLAEMSAHERAQLRWGDWSEYEGGLFKRSWFEVIPHIAPYRQLKRIRYWDLAATEKKPGNRPDWTVGLLMSRDQNGEYYIENVQRCQRSPMKVKELVQKVAKEDGLSVQIFMEREASGAGKTVIDDYRRNILPGYNFSEDMVREAKEMRAPPLARMAEAGHVKLVNGLWIRDWLDEIEVFPFGEKDDQVDAATGAFNKLTLGLQKTNKPLFLGGGWRDGLRMPLSGANLGRN